MNLLNFLRYTDFSGMSVNIFDLNADDTIYEGAILSIPWWIVDNMELVSKSELQGEAPIQLRHKKDHTPFVWICVKNRLG